MTASSPSVPPLPEVSSAAFYRVCTQIRALVGLAAIVRGRTVIGYGVIGKPGAVQEAFFICSNGWDYE